MNELLSDINTSAELAAPARFVDEQNPHEPYMTPDRPAQEMLSEVIAAGQRTKLTWADRAGYRSPLGRLVPQDKRIGLLDKRLPYVGPIAGFYVQNCKVVRSNGKEVVSILDVPEEMMYPPNSRHGQMIQVRAIVAEALAEQRKAAVKSDPLLCKVCAAHTSRNADEYAAHTYKMHQAEFFKMVGVDPAAPKTAAVAGGRPAARS